MCLLPRRLEQLQEPVKFTRLLALIRTITSSFLLVWQAPLGVRSAKSRHHSPEWTILRHSYRLIQGKIVWSQVLLDSLHPRSSRTSCWFPPVLRRGSSYDTPGICLVWHSCTMAEQRKTPCLDNSRQRSCPVVRLTSSLRTWWYHLIPNNFRKHHWSRASILSTSLLVTAQHSEPYRKIGRMQVLYNFSLVGMVILDFHQTCKNILFKMINK